MEKEKKKARGRGKGRDRLTVKLVAYGTAARGFGAQPRYIGP